MNERPGPNPDQPAVTEPGQPAGQLPFKSIWWLNAWATMFALGFYTLSSMATSDILLGDQTWSIFLAVLSLLESIPVGSVGTVIFLLTKRFVLRSDPSPRAAWLWLGLPAWIPALMLVAYAGWNCLPSQRLRTICKGHAVTASDISVVGATGLQVAEWLATFTVKPEEFQRLVRELALEPVSEEDFVARRENLCMLRNQPLAAEWPAVASTNLQCFRWILTGVDGIQHGDIHACYNVKTSRAIVLNSGY